MNELNSKTYLGVVITYDDNRCYGPGFEFIPLKNTAPNLLTVHKGIMLGGSNKNPYFSKQISVTSLNPLKYYDKSFWLYLLSETYPKNFTIELLSLNIAIDMINIAKKSIDETFYDDFAKINSNDMKCGHLE